MIESITVNEWKAEGKLESKIEALLGFLEARFGSVPAEVETRVKATTALDVLQRWVVFAGKAASLDEFRASAGF